MAHAKNGNCLEISQFDLKGYTKSNGDATEGQQPKEDDPLLDKSLASSNRSLQKKLWISAILLNIGAALVMSGQIIMAPIFSSIYGKGMGVIIPGIITASGILGSFTSTLMVTKLGFKTTLLLTSSLYTLALAGNFYPTWYTLIPTAFFGGICLAISSLTGRTYLGKIAHLYSSQFKQDKDRVYSRMFVLHVICMKAVAMFGNFCSSLILGATQQVETIDQLSRIQLPMFNNSSTSLLAYKDRVLEICGADYCNQDLGSSFDVLRHHTNASTDSAPSALQFYGLVSLCVAVCISGIIVLVFFVKGFKVNETDNRKSTSNLLLATFIQLKDPKLLLLLPMAISQQSADTFWVADFYKAFITCSSGIQYVGFVAIWSGISGAMSCFFFGWFNKTSIRSVPLTVATLAHLCVLLVINNWKPEKDNLIAMSAITAIWYLGSGIKLSLVPALFGVVFSDNMVVAYSNLHMWSFVGSTLMYSWSHFLCMNVKIYIMFGIVVISYAGYLIVEGIILVQKKNVRVLITSTQESQVNDVKDNCFVDSDDTPIASNSAFKS